MEIIFIRELIVAEFYSRLRLDDSSSHPDQQQVVTPLRDDELDGPHSCFFAPLRALREAVSSDNYRSFIQPFMNASILSNADSSVGRSGRKTILK